MTTIITVMLTHYDILENNTADALRPKLLETFIDTETTTAHSKAASYINGLNPMRLYLGNDGKVYPRVTIDKRYAI